MKYGEFLWKGQKNNKIGKEQKESIRSMHEERLVDLVQKNKFQENTQNDELFYNALSELR